MELITATTNNRGTLLENFKKEMAVLKELQQPIIDKANSSKNGEKERITARLTAIAKALTEVVTVDQGKELLAEQRELTEELTLAERIEQNMKAGFIAELEALAFPFYQQVAKTRKSFTELYLGVYESSAPQTVQSDITAVKELHQLLLETVGQVFNILGQTEVLEKSWNGNIMSKAVTKDGKTVVLSRSGSFEPRELENILKVVQGDSNNIKALGGGR